jgi:hypothetical protein
MRTFFHLFPCSFSPYYLPTAPKIGMILMRLVFRMKNSQLGHFGNQFSPQNLSSLSGFPLIQQIRMRFPSFFGSEEVVGWAYLI